MLRRRLTEDAFKLLLILLVYLLLLPDYVQSQIKETGLPFISNYSKSVYNASTQNWSVSQNNKGFLYFGNNDGLLEYDGQHWQTYSLPVQSIIRSVLAVEDTIYTGSFEEIGYFAPSGKGEIKFHSLSQLIPRPYRSFGEVWKIHKTNEGIVFQSFLYIFIYSKNRITVIKPKSTFTYSFYIGGRLLVVDKNNGIFEVTQAGLKFMYNHPLFQRDEIRCILEKNPKELLIGTFNKGIFVLDENSLQPWETPLNKELTDNALYSGIRLRDGFFAFGTIRNGIYITNNEGVIFQHVNRQKGLQNNTILSLFEDKRDNLWLGLDNGIDYVELNSPLSIYNYTYNIESTYCTMEFGGFLYAGTNQGLYRISLSDLNNRYIDRKFELVKGTEGQVWSLKVIENKLLCGHNYGCFLIEGNHVSKISDIQGFWNFMELNGRNDTLLAGTYNGLVIMVRNGNSWKAGKFVEGFSESCRFLEQDNDGSFWIAHGYRGLFHLDLSRDLSSVRSVKLYNKGHGLPDEFPYYLNKINNEILISTKEGFFAFNRDRKVFTSQGNYNEIFREQDYISEIVKDEEGNFWYFSANKVGVYRLLEDGSYNNIEIPFYPVNKTLIPSFENIYLYNKQNIYIGSQNGLIHYNPEFAIDYKHSDPVYIREVKFGNPENPVTILNPRLRSGAGRKESSDSLNVVIPYKNNSVNFSFTCPSYERQHNILYSYRLTGFEKNWSEWDNNNFKEYTNLREGVYIFEVRALNSYSSDGPVTTFTFRVDPPFHRSRLAYGFYTILLILIFAGNVYYQKKRIEKARAGELQKHEKELADQALSFREQSLIQEKEIVNLRNETLVNEMNHKNRELANSTLNLVHKNKILTSLKFQLSEMMNKTAGQADHKHELSSLVRKINKELSNEKHQEAFDSYFDEVHQDFIKRLKEVHPELTPKELRLCAYLKMNLSSKEIAPLMNISVRGLEISRYRLRKKLGIGHQVNLIDFIISF
ncbi:MAG: triple tyrosine motif-containing protein [Bacteroidota bacterium]